MSIAVSTLQCGYVVYRLSSVSPLSLRRLSPPLTEAPVGVRTFVGPVLCDGLRVVF